MGLRLRRFLELEDVVQECLLSAFQGFDGFRENSEGGFRNWLARFVEHKIVEVSRRASAKKRGASKVVRMNGSDQTLLYSAIQSKEPRPSEIARARELSEKIEEKLHLLSTIERELIIQRHLCEMSYAEIAKSMGLSSEVTVRMAVSRARRKLRGLLEL